MTRPLGYFVAYVMPASWLAAAAVGGVAWVVTPAVAFVLIPLFDQLLGHDRSDPGDGPRAAGFDLVLALWIPVQLALQVATIAVAGSLPAAEAAAMAVATGIVAGGGGITVAHELCHRKARWARAAAELLMTSVAYPWFTVEHVLGHHRRVATPADPATSRLGEGVYRFWFRSVFGGLRSAWALESERVLARGARGLADRRIRMALGLTAAVATAAAIGGLAGVAVFAAQAFVAVTLLEVINYVEHYGLVRAQTASGAYERVRPHHSWNSTHRLTGRLLFNLPRHADHHAFAHRPYDQLRPWTDAPELPYGYPTMVLIALVPPLWRRIMDPRVAAVRASIG